MKLKQWPISIKIILLVALLPLPQFVLPELTTLLLMPWWPIILLNLACILILNDIYRGRLPKWIVLIPVLYFGGYVVLLLASHYELSKVRSDLAEANGVIKTSFDSNKYYVLFDGVEGYPNTKGMSQFPYSSASAELIKRYDIPVLYTDGGNNFLSHRIVGKSICEKIRIGKALLHQKLISHNACIASHPETPSPPLYRITSKKSEQDDWILPTELRRITISDPAGSQVHLHGGIAKPFKWFPMPVIGCMANPFPSPGEPIAPPKCMVHFQRATVPITYAAEPAIGDAVIIANALGLEMAGERNDEEIAKLTEAAMGFIEAYKEKGRNEELEILEEFLNTMKRPKGNTSQLFELLKEQAESYAHLTDKIVPLYLSNHEAYTKRERTYDFQVLADIVAYLPHSSLQLYAADFIEIFRNYPERMGSRRLTIRLADLGEKVQDVYLSEIKRSVGKGKFELHAFLLGICRIGLPIAEQAKADVIRLFHETRRDGRGSFYSVHEAAYVALLRIGERDVALGDKYKYQSRNRQWYNHKKETVTPESLKSVCETARSSNLVPLPE